MPASGSEATSSILSLLPTSEAYHSLNPPHPPQITSDPDAAPTPVHRICALNPAHRSGAVPKVFHPDAMHSLRGKRDSWGSCSSSSCEHEQIFENIFFMLPFGPHSPSARTPRGPALRVSLDTVAVGPKDIGANCSGSVPLDWR
jgi:hypothetical protein